MNQSKVGFDSEVTEWAKAETERFGGSVQNPVDKRVIGPKMIELFAVLLSRSSKISPYGYPFVCANSP
jgi:hypothetical protein